jgi:hypothetical protein
MQLKLKQLILLIFAVVIIMSGCTTNNAQTIMSEELITSNIDDIDMIQIDYSKQESKQFVDKEVISSIYKSLCNMEMDKFSIKEEGSLIENTEILYSIVFISQEKVVGSAILFITGDIVMHDITTMNGSEGTQPYIYNNPNNEKLEDIKSIIEQLKE